MDADRFDTLVRSLRDAAPRRTVLGSMLGAGVATLLTRLGAEDAVARRKGKNRRKKRKRRRRKQQQQECPAGTIRCGQQCIPADDCCTDANCGVNERCTDGTCESCLPQGSTCTDDAQCCTDICDTYTNKCQQVRVDCSNGESCPNGRCCHQGGTTFHCLYEEATQGACVPGIGGSCGYIVCGNVCSEFGDDFCGFEGPAACRNGRCCCPPGILPDDCRDPDGGGLLPPCD